MGKILIRILNIGIDFFSKKHKNRPESNSGYFFKFWNSKVDYLKKIFCGAIKHKFHIFLFSLIM